MRFSLVVTIPMALMLLVAPSGGNAQPPEPAARRLTIVSAAALQPEGPIAPGSLASAFSSDGTSFAAGGSVTLLVGDTEAQVFRFSPEGGRVDFVVPEDLSPATGNTLVTLLISGEAGTFRAEGSARLARIAPALFTASGFVEGDFRTEFSPPSPLTVWDPDGHRFLGNPVDLRPGPALRLRLAATGVRAATHWTAFAGGSGSELPLRLLDPDPELPGVDLLEFQDPLPSGWNSRDAVQITIHAGNTASANSGTISLAGASPAPGNWASRPPLPEANSEMSVAAAGNLIYVFGGYPASRVSVRSVQVYDTVSGEWRITTPLPVALNHTMAASVNGKLYVIGGQTTAGGDGPFVNTVYEFDPATAAWTTKRPMPTARGGGAAGVIDGKIYVAGGRPPRGSDFAAYDPATDTWETLPDLPTQRNHIGAAAIGGKLWVVGGRFEAGFQSAKTDRLEAYDPATRRWSTYAPMPKPRGGVNAVAANGCLHVFGGEGNDMMPDGMFPDHDVYDPLTNTWSSLPEMPLPVHGVTGAAFVHGLIYLPGGGTSIGGSSGSTLHQVYRPSRTCR